VLFRRRQRSVEVDKYEGRKQTNPRLLGHRGEQDGVRNGEEAGQTVGLDGDEEDAMDHRRAALVVSLRGALQVEDAGQRQRERVSLVARRKWKRKGRTASR
jgi:hypothetical protein